MLEKIQQWDAGILLWIQNNLRNDDTTPFMTGISKLGNNGMIWIILAATLLALSAILMLGSKGKRKDYRKKYLPFTVGLSAALALLIGFIIVNLIIKGAVARPRPYVTLSEIKLIAPEDDEFSFPSGHSASSFAAATAMFIAFPKKEKWIGVLLIIFATMIAFSRLYVGIHYPTDVLCGILIGCACGIFSGKLCVMLAKKWNSSRSSIESEF